jgi:hypothetical protein
VLSFDEAVLVCHGWPRAGHGIAASVFLPATFLLPEPARYAVELPG